MPCRAKVTAPSLRTCWQLRYALLVVQHGAGKPSPWRVRGAPLGVGPGPSQAPDSEDISAAMAAAGNLAAFFPSTQAEPEADASTAAVNTAGAPSGSTATAGPTADKSNPTGAGSDDDAAQAVPTHAAPAPQPSASKAAGQTHGATAASDSGPPSAEAGAAEQQEAVAAAAASKSADMLSHAQPDDAEGVQTGRAAAPRQTSRRKQSGRAAVVDDEGEQGDQASGRGRGRARGQGSGARGGSGGRSRGRKRSSADMAAADEEARGEEPQRSATEVASCQMLLSKACLCCTQST